VAEISSVRKSIIIYRKH